MSKKILFFCGGAYISGLEVVTLHLMKGLKQKGYEVRCIFSGWNDGNFKKKLDEIGVPNYAIKVGWIYIRKPLWTLDTLIHYPKAFYTCKKVLKDYNPDICQFCNFSMSIMLYRLINQNSVYNLQETHHANFKTKSIFRLLNKKIKYFTAVSNHIVNVLTHLQIPEEKIKLIYNGIPIVETHLGIKTYQQNSSTLYFAIIGQVVVWKGHLVLVEAVENLIQRGINNFKVLIYGNDSTAFTLELKSIIKKRGLVHNFVWKGFINDQNKVYDDCDIVIVPSLSGEPCSLTIIESMARGKALIVSDRGGNPELVQDKVNGMIFNEVNPVQLSLCMEYLINNPSKITEFGIAGKNKAKLHYTCLNMTASYIDLYNKL